MKRLKYLLFILPFFFGLNVFAKDVDVTSNCYGTTGYASMYSGDEVQYQTYSNYSFGTTYQFQLSTFETELRYSLSANTDYVITFNTNNSNDFRNNFKTYNVYDLNNSNNNLVTGFTFVSMKKVQISFTTTTATDRVKIQMGGSNVYDNITGDTNWNIKNAILTIPDSAPSGSTNQDVINNATNNTNSIINNNNQNTSDIINNNNQNTQEIKDTITDNFNSCRDSINILGLQNTGSTTNGGITYSVQNGILTINGTATSSGRFVSVPLQSNITLSNGTYYTFSLNSEGSVSNGSPDIQLRDDSSNILNTNILYFPTTFNNKSGTVKYFAIYVSSGTTFNNYRIKPQIELGNHFTTFEKYGERVCKNKIDSTNEAIDSLTDSVNRSTQDTINSQKVCNLINKDNVILKNQYLNSSGNIRNDPQNAFGITDYIKISSSSSLIKVLNLNGSSGTSSCFYDSGKNLISCFNNYDSSMNENLIIPANSQYIRFTISYNADRPNFKICTNGNQAMNDYLNDDSNPNIADSEFTNLFNTVGFNDPLGYLLQLPVQFINQLVSQSNTCQTISLGTLWGVSLSLPCINIGSIIGQQVWDIIDVLFSVGLLVVIFKNLYQTFANLMTMGGEKEAREKFSMPTPMEFLSIILGGDR